MIKEIIEWIDIREQIPPEGAIILGYFPCLNGGVDIVKTHYGISQKEREELKNKNNERAKTYKLGDEEGNNLVPYGFDRVNGPGIYFGQQILCWAYINIPDKYKDISFAFKGNTELEETK